MSQLRLLKIALSLSLLINFWFWFKRPTEVVYEADKRVLEENEKKDKEIQSLQLERDSLKVARVKIIEKERIRYIKLKEDEKVIDNLPDAMAADSMLRAIW